MALLTLAEAKLQLNIDADYTDDDDELQAWCDAIAGAVEDHTGRIIEQRQFTETVRFRHGTIMLARVPVISLDALASPDGATAWDTGDFDLDPDAGEVTVMSGLGPRGRVRVTYTAGYADTEDDPMPGKFKRGAAVILQHVWETQRGVGAVSAGVIGEEEAYDPRASFAIPRKAEEWLGPPLAGVA